MKLHLSQALIPLWLLTLAASGSMTDDHELRPRRREILTDSNNSVTVALVKRTTPPGSSSPPRRARSGEAQTPVGSQSGRASTPPIEQTNPRGSSSPPAAQAGQIIGGAQTSNNPGLARSSSPTRERTQSPRSAVPSPRPAVPAAAQGGSSTAQGEPSVAQAGPSAAQARPRFKVPAPREPKRSISPNTFHRGLRQVADQAEKRNRMMYDHFETLRQADRMDYESRFNTHEQYIKSTRDNYVNTAGAFLGYFTGMEEGKRQRAGMPAHVSSAGPGPSRPPANAANRWGQRAASPDPPPAYHPDGFRPWPQQNTGPFESYLRGSPRGDSFGSYIPSLQDPRLPAGGLQQNQQYSSIPPGPTPGHPFYGQQPYPQNPGLAQVQRPVGNPQGLRGAPGSQGQSFDVPGGQSHGAPGRGASRGRDQT